jgi:hypothetical protein
MKLGVSVLVGVGLTIFLSVFSRIPGGGRKRSGCYRSGLRRGRRHSALRQLGR